MQEIVQQVLPSYRLVETDKNVGDECAVCHETRTRGRVIEKADALFGSHAEFICSKCAGK